MKFSYKFTKNGKTIDRCWTKSKRRFLKKLRTIKWQDGGLKVSIKVRYGKKKDVFGKLSYFCNEGEYDNKKDLWLAFEGFTEEE